MKLSDLKAKIGEYQYFEDTGVIDVALASIVATRLRLGDPVWLVVIGASSGGKSQILRPLALTDKGYLHRIDDLTENTFLSGMKTKEGENSLLNRIGGSGILVMSDLTVLFSKAKEAQGAILSQFRMIYDGEMVKHSGSKGDAVAWKGALGVLAGSTPSIYGHFEQVADMGERFIYYRMKEFDARKATHLALERRKFGKGLDEELSAVYAEYIRKVVEGAKDKTGDIVLGEAVMTRIVEIAMFAERVRTVAHVDQWSRDKKVDKIPVPAFPMRVALQLVSLAKGLAVMCMAEGRGLEEGELKIIDWIGWSLANEEKRACLRVLGSVEYEVGVRTQTVADKIGLDTSVINNVLQNMSAIGLLVRGGDSNGYIWNIKNRGDYETVRRVEGIEGGAVFDDRVLVAEEQDESASVIDDVWDKYTT